MMRSTSKIFDANLAHFVSLIIATSVICSTYGVDSEVKFVAVRNESDGRVMCGEVDNKVLTWSSTVRSQLECSSRCARYNNCSSFNYKHNYRGSQPQPVATMFSGDGHCMFLD